MRTQKPTALTCRPLIRGIHSCFNAVIAKPAEFLLYSK